MNSGFSRRGSSSNSVWILGEVMGQGAADSTLSTSLQKTYIQQYNNTEIITTQWSIVQLNCWNNDSAPLNRCLWEHQYDSRTPPSERSQYTGSYLQSPPWCTEQPGTRDVQYWASSVLLYGDCMAAHSVDVGVVQCCIYLIQNKKGSRLVAIGGSITLTKSIFTKGTLYTHNVIHLLVLQY